ncbi:isoleucine--tRNA ligase [Saccharopolyspora terrae]|uniref:Isoleucine--tRNA ligase n=1 Tax=Saccharopolyspora terrae TaxID=2530384 RepID=A0A4R4VH40_9PSEU|nr:isoleucine--tRNA ligase [Saccharopolyspora terrae]TDD04241.1 isoleucine--tRNA ligase [Saccharopolyspora terrae]
MRSASPFHPLASAIDLPEAERRRIEWWREHRIFERSLEQTADGPLWVFYEGPPTANGTPGTHHVEARVFKDVFPRFRTMKGFRVPRRAGWDCHGLPVELAVERELGLTGKPDVERLGIAEFNARCRESVQRYVGEFEAVTTRMGYWIDLSTAYWTMSASYVDSVWWALRRIFDAGLLVEDYRAAPYCPRDQTTLSAHEVAQGYETVEDPSIFVRLPLEEPLAGHDAELLVWTTTPWTLVSNTAVAVHPEVTYVLARGERGTFVVAESLADVVGGEVMARVPGRDLAGLAYRPPFDLVDVQDAHRVVLADYVSTTDGTGLVHLAPAFGPDDLATGRANGLPVVDPLGPDGRFDPALPLVGGMFFKDANPVLVEDLRRRDALAGEGTIEHAYPHCWRCHTPLMYRAQPSWYIRTTAIHPALQRENENTRWYPEHVKHGRFGDWLAGNVDWALSRNRYWGTPLPLWRCTDGHVTAIGSRAELGERTGRDLSGLDPHRPHIDEITFACPECGQRAARVPEVVDAWFDSGSMPFAQLGYPHAPGSAEALARNYPADYICEALDQTRGWFYTLMAIGTLLFDRSSYRNVVCLGHILAEDGRKMSKNLGNVLEPLPLMDAHGADALRWFMLCSGSPWSPRRVGHEALREIVRKVLLTYWNTASFFNRYAALSEWAEPDPPDERAVLDRWVLARLNQVVRQVDSRLEDYDTAGAGRVLAEFVDDLSNWYVRRSRPRFWDGEVNALRTLHECLDVLTRLLAPFIPFLTEEVWQRTVRPGSPDVPDSVHLSAWPEPGPVDEELLSLVDVERRLAVVGRSLRRDEALKVRQPLATAVISPDLPAELRADLAEEINVTEVVTGDVAGTGWPSEEQREVSIALDTAITPELRLAGLAREIIRFVQSCRKQDGREITDRISLRWSGSAEVGAALRAHRDEIAGAVLATEVVESDDADEHTDAKLGMSVTLVPA